MHRRSEFGGVGFCLARRLHTTPTRNFTHIHRGHDAWDPPSSHLSEYDMIQCVTRPVLSCSPPQTANKKMMSTLPAIAEDAPSNDQRSAPAPTLKHTVSKGSIQEMSQHVDPRRRSRSLSDEAIQKTYEERYATKEKGD